MAASITDLIDRVTDSTTGRPVISALASPGKALGAPSVNLTDVTNWSTASVKYFTIYNTITIAGVTVKDPSSQTDWKGTLAGNTISNLVLTGGSDKAYNAGAIVELTPTSRWAKDLYELISAFANQDGSLKSAPVKTALGLTTAAGGGWDILNGGTPPTVSSGYNNGNKEYKLTFTGVDLTSTLSAGMRLKFDRSVTAPTQCMSFTAASSQYATKASPTGITFTSAFTVEAWVYLNSYTSGGVVERRTSTDGWYLEVNATGTFSVGYHSASSFTTFTTYQSLPLKRWVHVVGIVTSASLKTAALYINGVSVPFQNGSNTNTTLPQAGSLAIGCYPVTPGIFFDGLMSEVRLWSTAQTATQIQDNMAVSLTGSETGLVGLWQGNGNFTDKTTNGNTLTATGGAIATQAANPYNTTEYAIVTKVTKPAADTIVTVFTGTDYNIPLATLINPFSSYQKAPFGFPVDEGKWTLTVIDRITEIQGSPVANTWYNPGFIQMQVPTGAWVLGYSGSGRTYNGTNLPNMSATLSTSASAPVDGELTTFFQATNPTANGIFAQLTRTKPLSLTAATTYYLDAMTTSASGSQIGFGGDIATTAITAKSAYI